MYQKKPSSMSKYLIKYPIINILAIAIRYLSVFWIIIENNVECGIESMQKTPKYIHLLIAYCAGFLNEKAHQQGEIVDLHLVSFCNF